MAIVCDTRQQRGKHDAKEAYFADAGELAVRCALPVGDYQRPAPVSVDTKRDINELAADIASDHDRFRREQQKARALGTQLVILVENEDGVRSLRDLGRWEEPSESWRIRRSKGAKRRYDGESLRKACETMHERYGTLFSFCHPEESGERVLAILDAFTGGAL